MSGLKIGRWLLAGSVVAAGVSACGARSSPSGDDAFAAGSASGGQSFAGARPRGGAPGSAGAFAVAGTTSFGGASNIGGVATMGGAPNVCTPGFMRCEGNLLEICTGPGNGYTAIDCGPNERCVQNGMFALCQPLQCQPGKFLCDATGTLAQVCAPDGLSALTKVDCSAQGQRCQDGMCQAPMCVTGMADCDGRAANGCETKLDSDDKNCGGCRNVCAVGDKCSGGKCSSRLTFTGIAQSLAPQSLTGWSLCYSETYGQSTTNIDTIRKLCTGSLLMMACRKVGSETLQLAAYAPRTDVMFDTGKGNDPHQANGVGWYFNGSRSWGFAPAGDVITRASCDTQGSSTIPGTDGELRLCWHTEDNYVKGGWRCGRDENLNASATFERLLFQAQ